MRRLTIGVFRLLLITTEWFYIPVAMAALPWYLVRTLLFPLPFWVLYSAAALLLLVNWIVFPFATAVMLSPVYLWSWLSKSKKGEPPDAPFN